MKSPHSGFTLIELLVVIAIIAVLSVVVVLSLNPAELLRQSRDANRLSDLSTLNSALALYTTDQAGIAGFSLGNASSVYVSLPDTSSTCGTWNLPTLPSGYTYACVASTSTKNINSSGWIPVNFSNISGGAPFSNLPLDNVNQSSTGLYYVYYSNGSQYEVTAIPESQKQKTALGAKTIIQNYPDVLANGSSLSISPLFSTSGLVGYWPLNEGTGSSAVDQSGNNSNGQWQGNASGTSGYYSAGKIPPWAGYFNGGNAYAAITSFPAQGQITFATWINPSSMGTGTGSDLMSEPCAGQTGYFVQLVPAGALEGGYQCLSGGGALIASGITTNQWQFVVVSVNGTTTTVYVNGLLKGSAGFSNKATNTAQELDIGRGSDGYFNGLMDDVRVYNRALSPAEVQALYNAEK